MPPGYRLAMTLRPDDLPLGDGTGHSPDEGVDVEGVTASESVPTADGTDEEPELPAHRTDVEGSPTGHS